MNIVIIGTGNVAQILAKKLLNATHTITGIWGRNKTTEKEVAAALKVPVLKGAVSPDTEMVIIATSDSVIEQVLQLLDIPPATIVVHTAAAVDIDVLLPFVNRGVLYPLQSIRKETEYLPPIPFFVEGSNEFALKKIYSLAETISSSPPQEAHREQRVLLHIAAVFSSNFTNYLYSVAASFCREEHIDFTMLIPLIRETAMRINDEYPEKWQTGPAARKDGITIQKHRALLEKYPEKLKLYNLLTEEIMKS